MFKTALLATASFATAVHGLGATLLNTDELYKDVTLAQVKKDVTLAQVYKDIEHHTRGYEPICMLKVHVVKPSTIVPKLPTLTYDDKLELPDAVKRRLARRY